MSTTAPDNRTTEYNPVSATTDFPVLFPVFSNSDIRVLVEGEIREDFTLTASYIDGVSNDATVVFSSGVIGNVLVVGARAPRRSNRFAEGKPLPTRDQNVALDTIQAEVQEANRDVIRAVKVKFGADEQELPDPRAETVIAWDDGKLENRSVQELLTDVGIIVPPGDLEFIDGGFYFPASEGFGPDVDGGEFE